MPATILRSVRQCVCFWVKTREPKFPPGTKNRRMMCDLPKDTRLLMSNQICLSGSVRADPDKEGAASVAKNRTLACNRGLNPNPKGRIQSDPIKTTTYNRWKEKAGE